MNVVAYLRVGTDEQMQSGLGLDAALTSEGIPTPTDRGRWNPGSIGGRLASAALNPVAPLSASEVA